MSKPQKTIVIWEAMEVDIRLQQFGLSEDILHNAIQAGAYARVTNKTANYPKCYAGLSDWAVTVKTLRDELLKQGWSRDQRNKLEGIISPDRRVVIVVESGDDRTGDRNADPGPSTKYQKGEGIEEVVERNYFFEFGDPNEKRMNQRIRSGEGFRFTWFLLRASVGDEIRTELSRPLSISNGYVTEWSERIILTAIPPQSEQLMIPKDSPVDPDVNVRRRK